MKRLRFLLLLLAALAAANDSDLDGVDDTNDRCPNTPFSLTVASDGCPEQASPAAFLIGIGTTYTRGTYGGTEQLDALSADVSAALFAGNFYVSVMSGYYFFGVEDPTVADSDRGGTADTFVGAGYTFTPTEHLTLTPGIHVKLATADKGLGTGETDFGASLLGIYRFSESDLFVQYGYTVTGDGATTYRDIAFGSAGLTVRPIPRGTLSLSYDFSQAYLPELPDLQSLSLMGSYRLYDTLSLQLSYSYGLSDSASEHALGIMLFKRF